MSTQSNTVFVTTNGIARRAGVHRSIVDRLLRQGRISADGFVDIGDGVTKQPLFLSERAVEVLRAKHPGPMAPITPKFS